MERKKRLTIGLIVLGILLLVFGGMYFFTKKESDENADVTISDSVRFSEEYEEVPEDNIFVYKDIDEIQKIFENGTGIVYLGFPECPWCQRYVVYLNEVAKEAGLEKIYYLNILQDRKDNTEGYQKLVSLLGDNLLNDNEGNPRIFVPDVSVIVSGEIIGHDNETSVVTKEDGTPEEYWTDEKVEVLKNRIRAFINSMSSDVCLTCD